MPSDPAQQNQPLCTLLYTYRPIHAAIIVLYIASCSSVAIAYRVLLDKVLDSSSASQPDILCY